MKHRCARLVQAAAIFGLAGELCAQGKESTEGAASRPPYRLLRYEEDYFYLRDPAKRSEFWDPIKYIPLDESGETYLSLGGSVRERFEYFRNYRWSRDSGDGYLLQRYLLHADLHLGRSFRAFAELQSSLESGREGGPRPTDEDELDVHQGFADVRVPLNEETSDDLTLRLGRQEMVYGSQRLISVRESPNIRRAFDAARVLSHWDGWRVDGFLGMPVEDDPGVFDDSSDERVKLWGIYATTPVRFMSGASVDLYYLGFDQRDAEFVQGTADEERHSVGARFFGSRAPWDYDLEGVFQWGRFGAGEIRAWTVGSSVGHTFARSAFSPRVTMNADVISGDSNGTDRDLGTFNAMFPKGAYFGEIAQIGPANLFDLHPAVELHVADGVTVSCDWDFFWRYSTDDGIYGSGGNVLRGADGDSRFIGHQPAIGAEWEIDRHATLNAVYSHFFAGPYIEHSGPGPDVDFVGVWIRYRF